MSNVIYLNPTRRRTLRGFIREDWRRTRAAWYNARRAI